MTASAQVSKSEGLLDVTDSDLTVLCDEMDELLAGG
jgi:hypothetical protein